MLIWHGQLPNYRIFHIWRQYLYWPKSWQVIFLLLFLYLGCTTNLKSNPFGYLLHLLVQGHGDPCVISRVCITEEVDGLVSRSQEVPQRLRYRPSWRPFRTCPWHVPVPLMKLFSGKKQTFQSLDYSPQSQIISSAELSDIGLRELRHTWFKYIVNVKIRHKI